MNELRLLPCLDSDKLAVLRRLESDIPRPLVASLGKQRSRPRRMASTSPAAIVRFFGPELMQRVQGRILDEFLGEQSVGTSLIVETGHRRHPFVAHTPTMRVPMDIAHTDNVYRAMWAMLLAVRLHNRSGAKSIEVVACPGLGTRTGHVPLPEAARQMSLAYRHYLIPPAGIDWSLAQSRQESIRYGGDLGFEFPPEEEL